MANISDALVLLNFNDKDGNRIKVNLDKDEYKTFRDKFCEMSYDCDGTYANDNVFVMYGRWNFTVNFGWSDIVKAYCDEIKAVNPSVAYIVARYRDSDIAMDWMGEYETIVNVETYKFEHTDLYGFDISKTFSEVDGDDDEAYQELYDKVIAYLDGINPKENMFKKTKDNRDKIETDYYRLCIVNSWEAFKQETLSNSMLDEYAMMLGHLYLKSDVDVSLSKLADILVQRGLEADVYAILEDAIGD